MHTLRALTPAVHWLSPDARTDRPTLGVVCGTRHTLLIDTGASPAHANDLKLALHAHGLPLPDLGHITHWHWDHVFGSAAFDIPTFATSETAHMIGEMAKLDWRDAALDARVSAGTEIAFCCDMIKAELPDRSHLRLRVPELTFDTRVCIDLGDVKCELIHIGGDHSPDHSIALVLQARVAFIADCMGDALYHGPPHLTPHSFERVLGRLEALDVDWYVTGHDDTPKSRAEFVREANDMRMVLQCLTRHDSRAAVLIALAQTRGIPASEDQIAILDALLAGPKPP